MSDDPDQRSVLARMIAAKKGNGPGQAQMVPGLQAGLTRAIRRAGQPFAGLTPDVGEVQVTRDAGLSDGIDALPEHGLLAAIEDGDGRRGLIALDHPLVDALIEVQATGRVEDTDLPPRPVTKIDEAMCRDFLDLVFGAFAKETGDQLGRDWPDRLSYGSRVPDRGQLNLLLPDRGYHLLETTVTAGGRKTGKLLLLLPADPAIARHHGTDPSVASPADWTGRMLEVLGAAPIALDAVLVRVTMPLGQVEALKEGDLVSFDRADLAAVNLEGEGASVFARGGLGQLGGRRALRVHGEGHGKQAAPPHLPGNPPYAQADTVAPLDPMQHVAQGLGIPPQATMLNATEQSPDPAQSAQVQPIDPATMPQGVAAISPTMSGQPGGPIGTPASVSPAPNVPVS